MRCRNYSIIDNKTKLCKYKFITPGGILCANKEMKDTLRCKDQEFQLGLYELLLSSGDHPEEKGGEL